MHYKTLFNWTGFCGEQCIALGFALRLKEFGWNNSPKILANAVSVDQQLLFLDGNGFILPGRYI